MRYLSWVLFGLVFWGLTTLHFKKPVLIPASWDGSSLADRTHGGMVRVRGTIVEIRSKVNGFRVVRLQADDGAPLHVALPPTIDVTLPPVGERVEVVGLQPEVGLITPQDREGVVRLEPLYSGDYVQVNTLKGQPEYTRLEIQARVVQMSVSRSGATYAELSVSGEYVGNCIIPAVVEGMVNGETQMLRGYKNSDGILMVERVGV